MKYELVIVGAGISGSAAALTANGLGVERALIVDFEKEIGGFASGLFQTNEFQKERQLMESAKHLPYEFRFKSTVVGFFSGEEGEPHQISLQTPSGSENVEAERVIVCSGSLEKPREAHLIAGTRPAGVMTPTMAMNLLARRYVPGENIVVIEYGRVSRETAGLLERQGCRVQRLDGRQWEVLEVQGNRRVSGVKIRNRNTNEIQIYACDTLVFGQGRIPCTFFLKGSDVKRDKHHAIMTDQFGRTNIARVSAAGTCVQMGDDDHMLSTASAEIAMHHLFKNIASNR